jgi:hypothetical protein
MQDTLPPHDDVAEAGCLGCVLSANGEAATLLEQLTLDDFFDVRHQEVFRALTSLKIDGKPLDPISVILWLRAKRKIDDAGGDAYVASLPDQTPSHLIFRNFLETVKDRATRRSVLRDAGELSLLAHDTTISTVGLADAAQRMLDAHGRTGTKQVPEIVDAADFLSKPNIKPTELVYGLLHQGSKMVLGGGSKTFKTWTLLDLALSVAFGEPWLSFKTVKGRVLYVNLEIQPAFFHDRITAGSREKGIVLCPGQFDVWNLRGHSAPHAAIIPRIITRVKQHGYALIILDPIYKLYGDTDENSASDVAGLMNSLERLSVETKAAVAFGAHYSKGNQASKETIDRISGSGVFARDPDTILNFTRHEEEDAFTVEATLRNFKPVDPFAVRWQHPLMRSADDLDPTKLKNIKGRRQQHTVEKILDLLKAEKGRKWATTTWQKKCESEKGVSKSTFYELLDKAKTDPQLKQTPAGQWFYEPSAT